MCLVVAVCLAMALAEHKTGHEYGNGINTETKASS